MQEISAELQRVREECFHILWGDYALHPVLPGTEGCRGCLFARPPLRHLV